MRIKEEEFIQIVKLNKLINKDIVIINIGTEKVVGDSYGPVLGSALKEKNLKNIFVYGSLDDNITAINLKNKYNDIKQRHPNALFIVVDACFTCDESTINTMFTNEGIEPGKGINKNIIGKIGDLSILFPVHYNKFNDTDRFEIMKNITIKDVLYKTNEIASLLESLDKSLEKIIV